MLVNGPVRADAVRPGLLITGTDTGVGKTTFSCLLAASLREMGQRVGVMKPAETGCPPNEAGALRPLDAISLRDAASCRFPLDTICPYVFPEPLAPLLAARRAGETISLSHIAACYREIEADSDLTLVEGAGGLLVPLTAQQTFADLASFLDLDVLVVVGSKLGCINHALLTIRHAQQVGLRVIGYVRNDLAVDPDLAQRTNGALLEEWLGPPLAILPFLGTATSYRLDPTPVLAAWTPR